MTAIDRQTLCASMTAEEMAQACIMVSLAKASQSTLKSDVSKYMSLAVKFVGIAKQLEALN